MTTVPIGTTGFTVDVPEPVKDPLGSIIPNRWGATWRAARDASKTTGKAHVAVMGDSIAELFYASTYPKSWVGLLRSSLQSSYKDGGTGYVGVVNSQLIGGSYGDNSMWPVTFTGAWTRLSYFDGPGMVNAYTSTPGDKVTFTGMRGTAAKIYTTGNAANVPFTVSVDGGAPQSFTTGAQFTVSVTTITGLTSGSHTIVVSAGAGVSSSNAFFAYGVSSEFSTGLVVSNYSSGATASGQWGSAGDMPGPGGAAPGVWSGGAQRPAQLVIYTVGVNDSAGIVSSPGGAATVDAYIDNVESAMAYVRANQTTPPDVLFYLPVIGAWQGSGPKFSNMRPRLAQYAQTNGYAYLDANVMYGNSRSVALAANYFGNGAPGAVGNDGVHPSDIGHAALFNMIKPLVS